MAAATNAVVPESGVWWNPAENGRGYTIELQGNILVFYTYLFDVSGRASWYGGAAALNADGSFDAQLQEYAGGQSLTGSYKLPTVKGNVTSVHLACSTTTTCNLTWAGGVVPIQRIRYSNGAVATNPPESGLWWNPAQSGRGYFVDLQGSVFAFYTYIFDNSGNATWYMSAGPLNADGSYDGKLQEYSDGQSLTGTYKAPSVKGNVSSVHWTCKSATACTLIWAGVPVEIQRFAFGSGPAAQDSAVPSTPVIAAGSVVNGNGIFSILSPASGTANVTKYTAECKSGGTSVAGWSLSTPLTVPNLISGNTYACTLQAWNSAGASFASEAYTLAVPKPTSVSGYAVATPSRLPYLPGRGLVSLPVVVSDYGKGYVQFPAESFTGLNFAKMSSPATSIGPIQILPIAHLADVNTDTVWAEGWTGKGTNITVIDNFQDKTIDASMKFAKVARSATTSDYTGSSTGSYSVDYLWRKSISHGEIVSSIAGGSSDGQTVSETTKFEMASYGALLGCNSTTISFWTPTGCPSAFYWGIYYPNSTFDIQYRRVAGLAKESLLTNDHVSIGSSKNALQTLTYIQGHLANSFGSDVINMSFGADLPTTGNTFDQVMNSVASVPLTTKANSVLVVAAGNGGSPCASQDLAGCNVIAVALAFQDATKDSTIVAGALEGAGSSENIATYSTRAGILANRFLLAQGTSGRTGVVGTSFAAPRIAGAAAIIKQKYPSLTSKQIADVLLLSANKDINNAGTPSFTGVHPVYGHGKLDLQRALTLAGSI
jgi:hypothetical protein